MEIITVMVWAFFGWACYAIAQSKGRNKELWAILGVLFGFIAVIIISFLPAISG